MVVEFSASCFCFVGPWPLYMEPVHIRLKMQNTSKLEPSCTTDSVLDLMTQDLSPKTERTTYRL